MKTFALILTALGLAILLASCGLIYTTSADKETQKLADKYGGIYVFDKKFRDEMTQREKEREEYSEKTFEYIRSISKGNEEYRENRKKYYKVDEKFPQTLSNGCEYFISNQNKKGQNFRFEGEKEFEFYENKIREYTGDEIYKKIKPYLGVRSYYECQGKRYPLTIKVDIPEVVTTYGLYGDEGRGFRLTQSYLRGISGNNVFYLINGKFIEYDELNKQKDIK